MASQEGTEHESSEALTLAAHALHERWVTDDVWHELATGRLSREQVVAIRRDFEAPEEIEHKLKLFGPTSKETRDRTKALLLQRYCTPHLALEADELRVEEPEAEGEHVGEQFVPRTIAPPRRARRWWRSTAITGLSLAAAMLLVWVVQRPERSEALPTFGLELGDGPSGPMRGGDALPLGAHGCDESLPAYPQDRSFSVMLAPSSSVEADLSIAAFAEPKSGSGRWLEPRQPKQSDEGVLEIDQPIAELGLTPGAWTLTFYVMRAGHDYGREQLRTIEPSEHPEVAVLPWSLCIVE